VRGGNGDNELSRERERVSSIHNVSTFASKSSNDSQSTIFQPILKEQVARPHLPAGGFPSIMIPDRDFLYL